MSGERFLLDTFFIQALLDHNDEYHERAKAFWPRVRAASRVWVTEAVLIEVANALSAFDRSAAAQFVKSCYHIANLQVVPVDTLLLMRALQLYEARPDKAWGLTDCISFVVMEEQGLTDAATGDHHFVQAGYRALLRE